MEKNDDYDSPLIVSAFQLNPPVSKQESDHFAYKSNYIRGERANSMQFVIKLLQTSGNILHVANPIGPFEYYTYNENTCTNLAMNANLST